MKMLPELNELSQPTRREFVALGIGAFVAAGLPLGLKARPRVARRTVPVMGTLADILVVQDDDRAAQAAIDAAIAELRSVDSIMTRFSETSEVGRVNRDALRRPVPVSVATGRVLGEALTWAHASEGAFDPCLARAVVLWDVGRRTSPPTQDAVGRFAHRRLYRDLELDESGGQIRVRLHDPDAAIDLGGIAKGYAVDSAVEALRVRGIRDALVNVGGDLFALGNSPDGDVWRVGVQDPENPKRILATLRARDCAIATSGDYIQYFEHGGRRYHHVLDPRTGEPTTSRTRSITVKARSCMEADAAGTAAFAMAPNAAADLLESRASGVRIVHRV